MPVENRYGLSMEIASIFYKFFEPKWLLSLWTKLVFENQADYHCNTPMALLEPIIQSEVSQEEKHQYSILMDVAFWNRLQTNLNKVPQHKGDQGAWYSSNNNGKLTTEVVTKLKLKLTSLHLLLSAFCSENSPES